MNIEQVISTYQLKVADAIECVCPANGFPKHYAIYAGRVNRKISFIANTMTGVRLIHGEELNSFISKYKLTEVERFHGTLTRQKPLSNARWIGSGKTSIRLS